MLKGISPVVSPELLYVLSSMGHGDQIVIADAHFPGHSVNENAMRADGLTISLLLDAILPLFPLDTYAESSLIMMSPVESDTCDPIVERNYKEIIRQHEPEEVEIAFYERFAFYEQAKQAFAVLVTGDVAKYSNIILTKGLVLS